MGGNRGEDLSLVSYGGESSCMNQATSSIHPDYMQDAIRQLDYWAAGLLEPCSSKDQKQGPPVTVSLLCVLKL